MITIAICTHNRADDVAACLMQLVPQLATTRDEVIVIDSASDCRNVKALKELRLEFQFELLTLKSPGLSAARNLALQNANGDWIAFLDDDTLPDQTWLSELHRHTDLATAEIGAIGGYTEPLWPIGQSHARVSARWRFFLSCIQSPIRQSVKTGANVCGANLAFRKSALQSIGGFRPDMGRIGSNLISGEESLAIKLLLKLTYDVIYEPTIRVRHRIHPDRLRVEWITRRAYCEGVSQIAVLRAAKERIPRHLGFGKLLASYLILRFLYIASCDVDFLIRAQLAVGSLLARISSLRLLDHSASWSTMRE